MNTKISSLVTAFLELDRNERREFLDQLTDILIDRPKIVATRPDLRSPLVGSGSPGVQTADDLANTGGSSQRNAAG